VDEAVQLARKIQPELRAGFKLQSHTFENAGVYYEFDALRLKAAIKKGELGAQNHEKFLSSKRQLLGSILPVQVRPQQHHEHLQHKSG
jgi:hypothetical protein